MRRTMSINVSREARRSILVDLLTVHALGGKAIVFTQTKREADEVAASLSLVHPCEVSPCIHSWLIAIAIMSVRSVWAWSDRGWSRLKVAACTLPCNEQF